MHKLKHLVEKELFTWEFFPINLPQTEFADRDAEKGRREDQSYFFQVPTFEDETRKLAFNADGSRKACLGLLIFLVIFLLPSTVTDERAIV